MIFGVKPFVCRSVLFFLLSCRSVLGLTESEALKLLQPIGGKLTPDFILRTAAKNSPSYLSLSSQELIAESLRTQSSSVTEGRAFAKASFLDDQLQPIGPFMPLRTIASRYAIGITKPYSTGTAFSFEISHGLTDLRFATQEIKPVETRATLSIEQSLWQNAFGLGTRRSQEALDLNASATEESLKDSKEQWYLETLASYYTAWLAQKRNHAAAQSVKRRERLQKIIEVKLNRGTSERPDWLQVKSAYQASLIQLSETRQVLGNTWRQLVTGLRLPEVFLQIDPATIPMDTDAPVESAVALCKDGAFQKTPPSGQPSIRKSQLQFEAARVGLEGADSSSKPDLKLGINLGSNGVDTTSGGTIDAFGNVRYPSIGFNLSLSVPLGESDASSKTQRAKAELIRSEATLSLMVDQNKVQWANACENLFRLNQNADLLSAALSMQTEREKLEQERFSIGRSTTLQVIQAGDDMNEIALRVQSNEIDLRQAAWLVKRLTGDVLKAVALIE